MLAFLLALRCATASRAQLNWPVRSMARQRSQSSGLISSILPVGPAMPALFTRQSSPPSTLSASSNSRATCARSETSHTLCVSLGSLAFARGERLLVHVADVHLGALAHEGAPDLEPDAARARRHQHAQILDAEIHGNILPPVIPEFRASPRASPEGQRNIRDPAPCVSFA